MVTSRRKLLAAAVAGALSIVAGAATAAEQAAAQQPAVKSEPIYGYQMMTPQERDEYREKMRNAGSAAERQAIRDEHHAAMVARAKERGLTLPDRPTGAGPYGPGAGRGPGGAGPRGPGMGPGGGGPRGPGMGPPEGYGPRGPGYGPRGPGYGPGAAQQ
jgi:hypothetical protein